MGGASALTRSGVLFENVQAKSYWSPRQARSSETPESTFREKIARLCC